MKKLLLFVALVAVCLGVSACSLEEKSVQNSSGVQEQNRTENNQRKLVQNQPPVSLDWSLERENINKRTSLWNDKNKIGYIYLINYGKVMAFYTIKGKVSSINSQITNSEQLTAKCVRADGTYRSDGYCSDFGEHIVTGSVPSPAEDGSYGTNGDAIFFFDTNGTYIEWLGDYMLADQPLHISTPVELTREVK